MEPHYNLPYRPTDIRNFPGWSPRPQSGYAIVPHEHQQQYQQQNHQQQPQLQPRLPPPVQAPSTLSHQALGPVQGQGQGSFQYGQYDGSQTPATLSNHVQQLSPYGQPYPVKYPGSVMGASTPKDIQSLPLPSQILPSQNAVQGPCMACGKSECNLSSHKYFSKHVQNNARRKRLSSSSSASTPRSSQTLLAIPTQMSKGHMLPPSIVLDPQREQLFSLWSKDWAPIRRGPERHLFPDKLIDRVLPAAKNHPPLLHALLAYSGTIWAIANNVLSDVSSGQQAFAVELLSQACPTEREASTDEGMLAATLLLLIYLAQGNGYEVGKHVSGLVHLTKLRGGPHYLGLSGLVADTLMYADHMQAIFFNQEPVWHLALPPLDVGLPPRAGQGFQKALASHELETPLAHAAKSVCRVADVFDEGSGGRPLSRVARNAFSYLSAIAEYQLARCNAAYGQGADTNECICLALIIFNYVVLSSDGAITPTILQVEHRFWHSLETAEAKGLKLKMSPCLYMWMITAALAVGVRAECQYRAVGIDKLRNSRQAARIHTWEHFRRDVLDEYVWLFEAQGDNLREIWAEVEARDGPGSTPIVPGHKLNVLPPAG